jgi:hypothetical protein
VEELDLDSWRQLPASPVDQPEDWSGSLDVDDSDLPEPAETHQSWDDPLQFVDRQD